MHGKPSLHEKQWGEAYKWIKKEPAKNTQETLVRHDGSITKDSREIADFLLSTLIPSDPNDAEITRLGNIYRPDFELTAEEVRSAIWSIGPKKAPGLNGICATILRKSWPTFKKEITHTFRKCMRECRFLISGKRRTSLRYSKEGTRIQHKLSLIDPLAYYQPYQKL